MKYGRLIMLSCLALVFIAGCREIPSDEEIKEIVSQYLAPKHYTVAVLELGEVREGSINTQVYMGKPSYTVSIKKITLVAEKDTVTPIPLTKGQTVTYKNAKIRVREKDRAQNKWEIAVVSGLPIL
ncbi:MAG: hypothetical protein ACYC69_11595 [Thermodesulfovibrionales bacterium]